MDFHKDWYERKFKPALDEDIEILMDGYDELFEGTKTEHLMSELIDLRYF